MKKILQLIVSVLSILTLAQADEVCDDTTKVLNSAKATLRSCSGWALNRLPVVKAWIRERAATVYSDSVTIDYAGGDPRFVVDQQFNITCTNGTEEQYVKQI